MLMLPLQSVNNNTLVTDPRKAKLYSLSFLFIFNLGANDNFILKN